MQPIRRSGSRQQRRHTELLPGQLRRHIPCPGQDRRERRQGRACMGVDEGQQARSSRPEESQVEL